MKVPKTPIVWLIAIAILVFGAAACADVSITQAHSFHAQAGDGSAKKTLRAFKSEAELRDFFREIAEQQRRAGRERAAQPGDAMANTSASPATGMAKAAKGEDESVTNVQQVGVDEGGIVKLHGNYLVMLRRGRLFTVAIGDNSLRPISSADAFGPEIDPRSSWYDELLISNNTVVVIGYSYERGGTEIGLFSIDDAGGLRYRSTHHLRSNDYYSSRNYASRLIGNKLIFYTPLYLSPYTEDPFGAFPAVRTWHKGAKEEEFQRIVSATRVYRPERSLNVANGLALHTVTTCDLSDGGFKCDATAVIDSPGRVFYVSGNAVYIWTTDYAWRRESQNQRSMLYRMPLDGSGPSALQVSGSPVDQFSFLESEDQHLNVLVRSEAAGDGMWGAENAAGDVALMRVPLRDFSDGSEAATASSYRELPKPEGYTFQNRFVGDYLLYGTGSGWGMPDNRNGSSLFAVRWAGERITEMQLPHGVDRIETMGQDAVIVGTDGANLNFTSVRLGRSPQIAGRYTRKGASQGELRSHGFFYKPDGPATGMLGLPIREPGKPGYRHLFDESASILFLRNDSLNLKELGALDSRPERAVDDGCRASCVDWYGNARPLFVRGRVFAMLGYEIVEGTVVDGRIRETRRITYAPRRQSVARR
jgi:hypothetical protein